jgi:ABC-2 type transport system ATP-binding protein
MQAIAVQHVRKEFPQQAKARPFAGAAGRRGFVAVDDLSLEIAQGEFFGLLGPNGAGKTTLVRMICTLLEPTAGSLYVFGYDAVRDPSEVRRRIGAVLAGERSVYWKLTGRENLDYFAALYRVPSRDTRRRIDAVLDQVGLSDRADAYVERYSHGMRQRLILARALLPDPPLLVLDEPTIGLDPQAARNLRALLQRLHREGRTILLTTHYMEEADQLCERIGIIDHGRIIALDDPTRLKRSVAPTGGRPAQVRVVGPTLEDVFLRLTGRHLRE